MRPVLYCKNGVKVLKLSELSFSVYPMKLESGIKLVMKFNNEPELIVDSLRVSNNTITDELVIKTEEDLIEKC